MYSIDFSVIISSIEVILVTLSPKTRIITYAKNLRIYLARLGYCVYMYTADYL